VLTIMAVPLSEASDPFITMGTPKYRSNLDIGDDRTDVCFTTWHSSDPLET
jgi:hypothetical protein